MTDLWRVPIPETDYALHYGHQVTTDDAEFGESWTLKHVGNDGMAVMVHAKTSRTWIARAETLCYARQHQPMKHPSTFELCFDRVERLQAVHDDAVATGHADTAMQALADLTRVKRHMKYRWAALYHEAYAPKAA